MMGFFEGGTPDVACCITADCSLVSESGLLTVYWPDAPSMFGGLQLRQREDGDGYYFMKSACQSEFVLMLRGSIVPDLFSEDCNIRMWVESWAQFHRAA